MIPTVSGSTAPSPLCAGPLDCLGSATHAVVGDATTSVFDSFASWLASGAAWLVTHVANTLSGPTEIDLSVGWFQANYRIMLGIGLALIAPMLAISTLGSVLRQDPKGLVRSWCVCLPLAVLGGFAALVLTSRALAVTDAMTKMLDPNPRQTLTPALAQMVKVLTPATLSSTDPALVIAIAALVVVVGGVAIWLELVVRAASVYVALVFLPLALAGLVWPATGRAARRLIEVLAALILFKFVIVAVLVLGAGAVGSGGMDGLIKGGALLLMAAFAPFSLFRLFPLVEAGLVGHLEGMSRRPARAAVSARSNPGVGMVMNRLSSAGGGGGRSSQPFFGEDPEGSGGGGPRSGGGQRNGGPGAGGPRAGGPGTGGLGTGGPDDRGGGGSDPSGSGGGDSGGGDSGGGDSGGGDSGGGDAGGMILAAGTRGEASGNFGGKSAGDAGAEGGGGANQGGANTGRFSGRGWRSGRTSDGAAGRGGGNPWSTTGRYEVPMARGGQLEEALAARNSADGAGVIGNRYSGATAMGTIAGNTTAGNTTTGNTTAGNTALGNTAGDDATNGVSGAAAKSAPVRGSSLGSVLSGEERP